MSSTSLAQPVTFLQGATAPGCEQSFSSNETRVPPPAETTQAPRNMENISSTPATGVRPKAKIGGSLMGRKLNLWTPAEQEELRQAGMRVASDQSTWKDEMTNMPAGTRLLNCQERFARFFKTTGSPKTKKAILQKKSSSAADSDLLRLPMLVRHKIWRLVKPEPIQLLAGAERLTHWWDGSNWVGIHPGHYFDIIAAYPLLLVNKQIHKECLPYNNNYMSIGFYALPDLAKYVADANRKQLALVSSYRVCVSKKDFKGVDLNLALQQELIGLYETVDVVDEDADEEQGGRGAVAVVGGMRDK